MIQTFSVNEVSIQTVIKLAKSGDEIILEENGKPIAKVTSLRDTNEDSWNTLFEAIEENQIETETTDFAHQHDHYLYGTAKRD